jgi:excinuclease ABC subunit A
MQVDRYKIHDIEIVIDRLTAEAASKLRIIESLQMCFQTLGKDQVLVVNHDDLGNDQFQKLIAI